MSDFEDLDQRLPMFVGELLGGVVCQWGDAPKRFRSNDALSTIDVISFSALGVDDLLIEEVPDDVDPVLNPPQGIRTTQIGQREFTLQVRVWSRSQRLARAARRHLDRMRTRLRLPEIQAELRGLGIAFIATEGLVDLDPVVDGRKVSESIMDVRFATTSEEAGELLPYIASLDVTSGTTGGDGLTRPDGTPSPAQIDTTISEPS